MKFVSSTKDLVKAVRTVEKVTGKGVASYLRIACDGTKTSLCVTDGTLSIEAEVPTVGECESGEACVDKRAFGGKVKKNKESLTTVIAHENELVIKDGAVKWSTMCKTVEPLSLEMPTESPLLILSATDLKRTVERVAFAADKESNKPVLEGIHIELCEDVVTMVALDGFRMSVQSLPQEKNVHALYSCTVPEYALSKVMRTIPKGNSKVEITFDEENLWVRHGQMTAKINLLGGEFPEYRKLFPKSTEYLATLPGRTWFVDGVESVNSVGWRDNNLLRLKFCDDKLQMIASTEKERAVETFTISDFDSKDTFEIGINAQFLKEALKSLDSDNVVLQQQKRTPFSPILIDESRGLYRNQHLILPIDFKSA